MRRTISGIAIVLLIGLLATPALAQRYTNFAFADRIELGQAKATVRVFNCWSEDGYTAKVRVIVLDSEKHQVRRITRLADDDGKTLVKIGTRLLPDGKYKIKVQCIHKFDGGGSGTWFKETGKFRVVPAS